jgi:GWxTD domain-containing protein
VRQRAAVLLLVACYLGTGLAFARAVEPSRQQRLASLPEDDRAWLTDFVAPIILPEEERVFLLLTDATQREGFKEDFWQRRETLGLPLPLGPGYRDRYRDLRQLVDEKYDGWQNDAGRLVLRRGEPDSIFKPQCSGEAVFRDLDVWTFGGLDLNGHPAARHIFYRPAPGAPRRLWIIHDGNAIVFQPNACRASFDRLSLDCRPTREDRCSRCEDRCVVYETWAEILKRQGGPAGALAEQGELFGYPKIPTEGLGRPKSRWAAPAVSVAKAPAANTTPSATPTAVRRPTLTLTPSAMRQPPSAPTPSAVRQPTGTPVPQAARTLAPARTPTAARSTPAPTRPPAIATTPKPTAAPAPTPAPTRAVEGLRRLSSEEIRDRISTLEPEYKEFLDLARPLLTEEETSRFLQLSGHDKDAFIRDFWKRHS